MYKDSRVRSGGFECPTLLLCDSVPTTVRRYIQQADRDQKGKEPERAEREGK